jgi:hypothetical protein
MLSRQLREDIWANVVVPFITIFHKDTIDRNDLQTEPALLPSTNCIQHLSLSAFPEWQDVVLLVCLTCKLSAICLRGYSLKA